MKYSGITVDSRKVKPGYIFVALKGQKNNGELYIPNAIANGASLIISERSVELPYPVEIRVVANAHLEYSRLAAQIYPSCPKRLVGVTGTNGKTSVADYYRQLAEGLNLSAASIGTLGVIAGKFSPSFDFEILTSPQPEDLHRLLNEMEHSGLTDVAIEVSSHGLDQHRVDHLPFSAVGFTNFTRDHIDYHGTMENYLGAKLRLFSDFNYNHAVINIDDPYAEHFIAACGKKPIITYGHKQNADICILSFSNNIAEVSFFGAKSEFSLNLAGDFQIYNAICAYGLALSAGHPEKVLRELLPTLRAAPGRLELVGTKNGASIYIDYAHTPDALENVLASLRNMTPGRIIVVFGCGGDRDPGKRPMMAEVCSRLADLVIVTDDNPRTEDPAKIRQDVLQGATTAAMEIAGRDNAIAHAIEQLRPTDALLIAGKGHEDYQIIGSEKVHFSDREEAMRNLQQLSL